MKSQSLIIQTIGKEAVVRTKVNTFSVASATNKNRKNCSPVELLMSSLGSWIALTISAVAESKKIELEKLDVNIDFKVIDVRSYACNYMITLDFGSGLDKKAQAILLGAARSCHIGKILKGELNFEYSLNSVIDEKQ